MSQLFDFLLHCYSSIVTPMHYVQKCCVSFTVYRFHCCYIYRVLELHLSRAFLLTIVTMVTLCYCCSNSYFIRLEPRLQPNIGFAFENALTVFTRSDRTLPKANRL